MHCVFFNRSYTFAFGQCVFRLEIPVVNDGFWKRSLLFIGKREGGNDSRIGVSVSSVRISFPAPSLDFSPLHWVCGTVYESRDGVEHKS